MLLTLMGRLAQFVIMFASVRIMTELLPPAEIGRIAIITTTVSLFALILINPAGMFLNRRIHSWTQQGTAQSYLKLYLLYITAVCFFAATTISLFMVFGITIANTPTKWLTTLICGSLFFNTIIQTLVPSLNLIGRKKSFTLLTLGTLSASLAMSVLLVRSQNPTAESWLVGGLISQILFTPITYVVFFWRNEKIKNHLPTITATSAKRFLTFSWPVSATVLLQWTQMQGYRFFLEKEFGLAQLGLYVAGYGIAAALISAAEIILTTWYQPNFYRNANSTDIKKNRDAWTDYASKMIPASLLALTGIIAISPTLPRLMLGEAFHNVTHYVVFGAFAEWARMTVNILGLHSHLKMATKSLITPNCIGLGISFVVFYTLIDTTAMLTAPIAILLGCSATAIYLYQANIKNDITSIPNIKIRPRLIVLLFFAAFCIASLQAWTLNHNYRSSTIILLAITIGGWSTMSWFLLKPIPKSSQ